MENTLPCIDAAMCATPVQTLHIVTDVERCSHVPAPALPAFSLSALPGAVVSEALFPEVRTLAHILAQGQCPTRVDWLAARVVVFRLNHLSLSLSELDSMDSINHKLDGLARCLGLELTQLRSFALCGQLPGILCHAGVPMLLSQQGSLVEQSLSLREQLRPWLQQLVQAWQHHFGFVHGG